MQKLILVILAETVTMAEVEGVLQAVEEAITGETVIIAEVIIIITAEALMMTMMMTILCGSMGWHLQ